MAHDIKLLLIFLVFKFVICQKARDFPVLFNTAKDKPVSTIPAASTCGAYIQNAYCKSTIFANSIYECRQDYCVQDCPRRTKLPVYSDLLLANGFGLCVTHDAVNLRPGAAGGYSAVFHNKTKCYLQVISPPNLGANGAFTLTFWMWQENNNVGLVTFTIFFEMEHQNILPPLAFQRVKKFNCYLRPDLNE